MAIKAEAAGIWFALGPDEPGAIEINVRSIFRDRHQHPVRSMLIDSKTTFQTVLAQLKGGQVRVY